jgi:hypothetical protein
MSRVVALTLAHALGLAAALALVSCGGGGRDAKLLPGTTAKEITENLESVRNLAAEGECVDAQDAALEVSTQVEDLHGIDPKLKELLQEGAERLNEVVLTCTEATTAEDTEEIAPTTTEETTVPTKPEKQKPEKEKHEAAEPPEEAQEESEGPGKSGEAPPKGEAKGHEEPPEAAPEESPSGGIGPGTEAGG